MELTEEEKKEIEYDIRQERNQEAQQNAYDEALNDFLHEHPELYKEFVEDEGLSDRFDAYLKDAYNQYVDICRSTPKRF